MEMMEGVTHSVCVDRPTAAGAHKTHVVAGIIAILVLISAVSFLPASWCKFINFDDTAYVTTNPYVKKGLTLENVEWAVTNPVLSLYHPLSTLSFMADYELFELNPAGFHIENVLIHVLNVVLLFTLLRMATGSLWRSASMAAIFGIHPLRVESVLWVSERKDVLSLLFGLLAMIAYVWHCRRPHAWRAGVCAVLFALSLLAKPMLVTLPFVLLLLDYWPLGRMKRGPASVRQDVFSRRPLWFLIVEKVLLFVLAFVSVRTTAPSVAFIRGSQAVSEPAQLPPAALDYTLFMDFSWRIRNVPVSYVRYLYKMVDFSHLAAFYPTVRWSPWQVGGSSLLLVAISGWIIWRSRRNPWLAVGWAWFVGSLVPVIGIVMVSAYSLADRYTYFPMIGILIAVIWSFPDRWAATVHRRRIIGTVAACVLTLLAVSSFVHASYWRNSSTLWEHAIAVTQDNWLAHDNLGSDLAFGDHPDIPRALLELKEAERLEPHDDHPYFLRGIVLYRLQRNDEAIEEYRQAVRWNPQNAIAAEDLAVLLNKRALLLEKKEELSNQQAAYAEALAMANQSLATDPRYIPARVTKAVALTGLGRLQDAMKACDEALELNPLTIEAHHQMGIVLLKLGRASDAVQSLEKAQALSPNDPAIKVDLLSARARRAGPQPEPGSARN